MRKEETTFPDVVEDKSRGRRDCGVQEKEGEIEDFWVYNQLDVNAFSDLLSCKGKEEIAVVDFNIFTEGRDIDNVEEINLFLSGVRDSESLNMATTSSLSDGMDTGMLENPTEADPLQSLGLYSSFDSIEESLELNGEDTAILSDIFAASMKDEDVDDPVLDLPKAASFALSDDGREVDSVEKLSSSLHKSNGADHEGAGIVDELATQDWIDALENDNMASLFSELDQTEKLVMKTQSVAGIPVNVDSRIFIPTFSVQIEGGQRPRRQRPALGPASRLLVGPPGITLAGPPSHDERVGNWKAKRKISSAVSTKKSDPSVSIKRRMSAAKRQRVKGRFVSDTHSFVSITALQT